MSCVRVIYINGEYVEFIGFRYYLWALFRNMSLSSHRFLFANTIDFYLLIYCFFISFSHLVSATSCGMCLHSKWAQIIIIYQLKRNLVVVGSVNLLQYYFCDCVHYYLRWSPTHMLFFRLVFLLFFLFQMNAVSICIFYYLSNTSKLEIIQIQNKIN